MKRNTQGGAPAASPTVAAPAAEPTRAIETPASPAPAAAPAPAAGPTRFSAVDAITFVDQARAYNNDALVTRATELVQQNDRGEIGTEAARSAFMQAAAEAQRAATSTVRTGPSAQVTGDSSEQTRGLIVDAIVARSTGGQVPDASREFMGMSLLSIAAARAGISPTVRDADTILRAAGTTSDFPMLLEAAANKVLMARYQSANPTYQAISARRDLRDFKQTKLLRVGDFPTLLPYAEDGEIKSGTINEGRETVILGSYGRKVLLTRQAIVNDDLGAFNDVFGSIGLVVSLFENALFFAMKSSGNGNGPKLSDNKALFDAAHGNLAAAGAAVAIDTLSAGRAAMRKQKNLDGNPLNYSPSIIMVGPDIETAVQQFLAPIQAQQAGNVNPFAGTLQMEVDANIDDNSWELYTSPGLLPAFNYGYLESAPGPRVMTKEGYDHDGISFRVTEDFYAAPVDYRGAYRNPGV